jgi:competence protein ComGF
MRIKSTIHNEKGYTLMESLFQLMVFVLFATISLLLIVWIRDSYNFEKIKEDVNWELFIYDLNQYNEKSVNGDLLDAKKLRMEFLTDPNDLEDLIYIFTLSDNHLYKSSKKGGYEIMLPHVSNWTLKQEGTDILMKVVMKDGTIRERSIVLPKVQ